MNKLDFNLRFCRVLVGTIIYIIIFYEFFIMVFLHDFVSSVHNKFTIKYVLHYQNKKYDIFCTCHDVCYRLAKFELRTPLMNVTTKQQIVLGGKSSLRIK
jgi:hypothetical protein